MFSELQAAGDAVRIRGYPVPLPLLPLRARVVPSVVVGSDQGSGSGTKLTLHEPAPEGVPAGWLQLGHGAVSGQGVIVVEPSPAVVSCTCVFGAISHSTVHDFKSMQLRASYHITYMICYRTILNI